MDTTKTEGDIDTTNNGGEGESKVENITLTKEEYDKFNQTIGSLKREIKDLKKPKEDVRETPTENQKPDSELLQKLERISLRQAGITDPDDMELARNTAKKWNMDIDEVLADEDFRVKLEKQQTARTNLQATSGIKGSGNGSASQAKNTVEYWQAKGTPPTPADVPDTAKRREIINSLLRSAKGNGKMKFYNS